MTPSRKSVLVLDDEMPIVRNLVRWLRLEGYEVHTASTCAEAFREVEKSRLDCAVLDLVLPDGSGLDVLRRMKEGFPEARIVLATGFASVRTAVEAMRLGAVDCLLKPVQRDEVIAALDPSRTGEPRVTDELPTLDRVQWDYIQRVLVYCDGNISESARRLGIHRQSLQRMLRKNPPRQ